MVLTHTHSLCAYAAFMRLTFLVFRVQGIAITSNFTHWTTNQLVRLVIQALE